MKLLIGIIFFAHIYGSSCDSIAWLSGGAQGEALSPRSAVVLSGQSVTIICNATGGALYWKKGKHNLTDSERHVITTTSKAASDKKDEASVQSVLNINSVGLHDAGHYRCLVAGADSDDKKASADTEEHFLLKVHAAPVLLSVVNATDGVVGRKVKVTCTFESNPAPDITWYRNKTPLNQDKRFVVNSRNESNLHLSQLVLENATLKDNGTYECVADNSVGPALQIGRPYMLMHELPLVTWKIARSLGPEDIQLVWEVKDKQHLLTGIEVWVSDDGTQDKAERWRILTPDQTSVVLDDGVVDAVRGGGQIVSVWLRLSTTIGHEVLSETRNITMLRKVPEFIPSGSFRGSALDSLTTTWTRPDDQLAQYVSHFMLTLMDVRTGATERVKLNNSTTEYRFTNLKPATHYNFTVSACMGVYELELRDCGPPSPVATGNTLYNTPEKVEDVVVTCQHNGYSGWSVDVKWKPSSSQEPGKFDHYKLELTSIAQYTDANGQTRYEDNDRREENVSANFTSYTFIDASANTHYTVKVSAGIKRIYSRPVTAQCRMPVWIPRQYSFQWWKANPGQVEVEQRYTSADGTPLPALLKMPAPLVSQRNGTICCQRVVVVKLGPDTTVSELPSPAELPLVSYKDAHSDPGTQAYVAEAFTKLKDNYLFMGDNMTVGGNWSEGCGACLSSPVSGTVQKTRGPLLSVFSSSTTTTTTVQPFSTAKATVTTTTSLGSTANSTVAARREARAVIAPYIIEDGQLSSVHNYTGFLIFTVMGSNERPMHRHSEYFNAVVPAVTPPPVPPPALPQEPRELILYVAVGVLLLLLLITIALCAVLVFYKRRNKHLEDELVYNGSLSGTLGKIFRSLRKSNTLISQHSIDVKPINKEDLVKVYLENIKDSELGFRREYEALPEKFVDRSSRGSELTENCGKNRYPDIKAYDQTRVKLHVSSSHPSDYINANFVLGYKERKKFICAQGPMEATVDDFWRMVVEQGCSLCVMLTNLEENGKTKCVKYWPEAGQPKTFGNITVRLVKEKCYADYIVRTLRAEWPAPSVGSNPDVSIKGVVGGEGSTSTNTSSASNHSLATISGEELKYHEVEQYHYLMWKDFVAPEHPVGILAFLRRMNEAYSHEKGPLLVHCSAGVGRTGTLVALDSLVAELDEENQASVYNLICDLRHQRNFLVQSLKQYVFIHRALMEHAQFGSTEQTPEELRQAYVKHVGQMQQGVSKPVLIEEFEMLGKVIEERKAFTIATSDENKNKNRYDFVLPYDSNRVILSPLGGKPTNTYINGSFVAGFDLDEHFIVTQDPLDNTVTDFWRMIYEQDVTTLVMLSELGSGGNLCMKYWPEDDEESAYEHLRVKLLTSESYPKFSCRVFQLTNAKSGDTRRVSQFQYVGWSGSLGEVPVGTFGIMEVINRVQSHVHANLSASMPTPVLLHCSGGGDRCSVYVCLNNCLRQLRREGRVDVFQTARKIRAMRQFMLQSPSQYEFCYKALIEYIDNKGMDNI